MNRSNNSFWKAVRETFGKIKQDERISQHEINASWKEVEKMLSVTPQVAVKEKRMKKQLFTVALFAASFLLVISLAVSQLSPTLEAPVQMNDIIVTEGRNKQLTLSDGTKIHIKANSHIIYPSVFEANRREITLVKGEIYLDVTHNSEAPFMVKTNDFEVKVLGTQFNVSAPDNGKPATVVLVEGCVEIENKKKHKALLQPNQLANISARGINIEQVDVVKHICWKDQIMLLEGDQLAGILEQLSSFYGVTICCDKKIENFTLSGKLDLNESVEKTIRVIKLSTGFNYKKDKDGFCIYK